jgi:osmotically-inducible protein OsmY
MRLGYTLKTLLAAVLMLGLISCAHTVTREGASEYVHDAMITTKVKVSLAVHPDVRSTEVNVETFKGTVQLSGFVSSRESIQKAVDITRGVGGVLGVKNDMLVK